MFVNEFFFSFFLLSFAGLLLLLGLIMLADGAVRLGREWGRQRRPKAVIQTTREEKFTSAQRAA